MKILVVLKQRTKYTQEIEFEFDSWGRTKDFVQEALLSGKDITVEMSAIPDPEEQKDKKNRFVLDSDGNRIQLPYLDD